MPKRVVLYERPGCHLCEDAAGLLDQIVGPDRYERVDVDTDDDLLVRYGHRIPVVTVDGAERLELIIGSPEVRALKAELDR
ncbi:MAG TPA: glutaredoxin family protein [Candidatus Limnocylindria bacterium]|nr:glutaredoxin family protein [Candidatus Limnocylindria bacterium]